MPLIGLLLSLVWVFIAVICDELRGTGLRPIEFFLFPLFVPFWKIQEKIDEARKNKKREMQEKKDKESEDYFKSDNSCKICIILMVVLAVVTGFFIILYCKDIL